MIRQLVFGALLWSVCLYVFVRGDKIERIVALGILLNVYLTFLLVSPFSTRYAHIETSVMLTDVVLTGLFLGIALQSDRFWPMWLTAMQAIGTLAHLAPYVPHILPWTYGNATAIWMYPILIVLGVATHRHRLERQREQRQRFRS